MTLPATYWRSFDAKVDSIAEYLDAVRMISAYQAATNSRFVWRGAVDEAWPMYSSLVRAFIAKNGRVPLERELRQFEAAVLQEARDWSLDWHQNGGRLTALELLAALQHYGVPTRLLDFTFNPMIALWFAAESLDDRAGRVFAIDISDRLVSRERASSPDPWWMEVEPSTVSDWATQAWVWAPPPIEPRIVRQDGCFVMGGIPSTNPARNQRVGTAWRLLRAPEVRACMSLPFKLIQYDQAVAAFSGERLQGAQPRARAFTLRITGNKQEIRTELGRGFGHTHRSLFPDFPGLARFGNTFQ